MRLPNYQTDFSPYFSRPNAEVRVRIPNNVKIVIGTESFDCSGPILARQSTILLEKILTQQEIYLDEFVDCVEGVLDCMDLLYGADVVISMENIQAMFKFCMLYKIEGVFGVCLEWVHKQLVLNNFLVFYRMGLFLKCIEVEQDEILTSCKELILESSPEDLLQVSESWYEDKSAMSFLLDKELLPSTLPVITKWVDSEQKVISILDKLDEFQPEETSTALQNVPLMSKMNELCETVPSLRRINRLQMLLASQSIQQTSGSEPPEKRFKADSLTNLKRMKSKAWRKFDKGELMSLDQQLDHFFYVEILVDWIAFHMPTLEVVDELWRTVKQEELDCEYLYYLANLITGLTNRQNVPYNHITPLLIQRNPGLNYQFNSGEVESQSQRVVDSLRKVNHELVKVWQNCQFQSCHLKTEHRMVFKLIIGTPCYKLGVRTVGDRRGHYHHDKVKHFYATEIVNGERVLLSFVTNSRREIIDKVETVSVTGINLHYLYTLRDKK